MKVLTKTVMVLGASLFITAAHACDEATIDHVSVNGDIIEIDGTEYTVTSGDASGWSEGDDVLVCDGKIIHKDDGEQITVTER